MKSNTLTTPAFILACALILLGSAKANVSYTYFFTLGPRDSQEVASALAVIRKRLEMAGLNAEATVTGDCLKVASTADAHEVRELVTGRGDLQLRIMPHGPIFTPSPKDPVYAEAGYDETGHPRLLLRIHDIRAFKRFTAANVGHRLAAYLDNRKIFEATLMQPVTDGVSEVIGGGSYSHIRAVAALIDVGPAYYSIQPVHRCAGASKDSQ